MWPKHDDEMEAREVVRGAIMDAWADYMRQQHVATVARVGYLPDALLDSLTAAAVTAVIDRADRLRVQEAERRRPFLDERARKMNEAVAEVLAKSGIVLG